MASIDWREAEESSLLGILDSRTPPVRPPSLPASLPVYVIAAPDKLLRRLLFLDVVKIRGDLVRSRPRPMAPGGRPTRAGHARPAASAGWLPLSTALRYLSRPPCPLRRKPASLPLSSDRLPPSHAITELALASFRSPLEKTRRRRRRRHHHLRVRM